MIYRLAAAACWLLWTRGHKLHVLLASYRLSPLIEFQSLRSSTNRSARSLPPSPNPPSLSDKKVTAHHIVEWWRPSPFLCWQAADGGRAGQCITFAGRWFRMERGRAHTTYIVYSINNNGQLAKRKRERERWREKKIGREVTMRKYTR